MVYSKELIKEAIELRSSGVSAKSVYGLQIPGVTERV